MKNNMFKRIAATTLSLAFAVPVVGVTLTACNNGNTPPEAEAPEVTLTSIVLDTSAVKTQFSYGEAFTYEGLKVTAKMSDGTEQPVSLSECTVSTPVMNIPGTRRVNVRYKGKSATYDIVVADRIMPEINKTPVFEAKGENPAASFRVEAESIDLAISGVKASGGDLVVEDATVSGGKYLANYGTEGNYFGFTFTAEQEYTGVTLVLRVANATESALGLGTNMNMYHNYVSSTETGAMDISALTAVNAAEKSEEGAVSLVWTDKVLRDVTIPAGTNTLTFDVLGGDVLCIDYVEFYIGAKYSSNNRTVLQEVGTVVKEFEDFDLERIAVRGDIKAAYNLPDGVAFVETPSTNNENTSGGKSVGAFVVPTEISTVLAMEEKATVRIWFTAASVKTNKVKENFKFTIDGVELTDIEDKDIKDGDPAKNEYWLWKDTCLGTYDLPAGDHLFVMKMISGSDYNADCFKFEVLSYGEFTEHPALPDVPASYDVTISKNGSFVKEAETLDKAGVVTRQDFIDAGVLTAGEYATASNGSASGRAAIYGFGAGTKFNVSLKAEADCKVNIALTLYSDCTETFGENFDFKLDDTLLTQANPDETMTPNQVWKKVIVAREVALTAGEHTFAMEVKASHFDFDCITFTTTEYDGVAAPEETDPVEQYDLTLTGAADEYTVEAEDLDLSNIVKDSGEYTEKWAEGKYSLRGIQGSSVLTIRIKAEQAVTVDFSAIMSKYEALDVKDMFTVTLDGATSVAVPSLILGRAEDGSNDWFNWKTVDFGRLELPAGSHTIVLNFISAGPNIDCFKFTVAAANA